MGRKQVYEDIEEIPTFTNKTKAIASRFNLFQCANGQLRAKGQSYDTNRYYCTCGVCHDVRLLWNRQHNFGKWQRAKFPSNSKSVQKAAVRKLQLGDIDVDERQHKPIRGCPPRKHDAAAVPKSLTTEAASLSPNESSCMGGVQHDNHDTAPVETAAPKSLLTSPSEAVSLSPNKSSRTGGVQHKNHDMMAGIKPALKQPPTSHLKADMSLLPKKPSLASSHDAAGIEPAPNNDDNTEDASPSPRKSFLKSRVLQVEKVVKGTLPWDQVLEEVQHRRVCNCKDGGAYEGEILGNKQNGYGIVTLPNGTKYEGEWQNGKRHGHGVRTSESGSFYDGEWKADKFSGHGTMRWPSGEKYIGEWLDGKRNGQGTNTFPSGNKYEGKWKSDCRCGYGVNTFSTGAKYKGEWCDNKRNGQGTNKFVNGAMFSGGWKDDKLHGKGVYVSASGLREEQVWSNGVKQSAYVIVERDR